MKLHIQRIVTCWNRAKGVDISLSLTASGHLTVPHRDKLLTTVCPNRWVNVCVTYVGFHGLWGCVLCDVGAEPEEILFFQIVTESDLCEVWDEVEETVELEEYNTT